MFLDIKCLRFYFFFFTSRMENINTYFEAKTAGEKYSIPKNGFCFFFVSRNSCAKYILSTAFASLEERRVIPPNVRFLRHYSIPDICLEHFCAFRCPPHVDYPPL